VRLPLIDALDLTDVRVDVVDAGHVLGIRVFRSATGAIAGAWVFRAHRAKWEDDLPDLAGGSSEPWTRRYAERVLLRWLDGEDVDTRRERRAS